MTKTSRDKDGKLRVAKGDHTGLGGQYAPDVKAAAVRKAELHAFIDNIVTPTKYENIKPQVQYSILNLQARMVHNVSSYETKMVSETLFNNYLLSTEDERKTMLKLMANPLEKFWLAHLPEKRRNRVLASKVINESVRKILKDSYNASAIWTDVEPDDEESFGYTIHDLSSEAKDKANSDIERFVSQYPELVTEALNANGYDASSLGHDLWLTRTGQGVGFWDREQLKENNLGNKLTEAVKTSLPSVGLIVDDNKILQYE